MLPPDDLQTVYEIIPITIASEIKRKKRNSPDQSFANNFKNGYNSNSNHHVMLKREAKSVYLNDFNFVNNSMRKIQTLSLSFQNYNCFI